MHASSLPQPGFSSNPNSAQPWLQGLHSLGVPAAPYSTPQWQTAYQPQWSNSLLPQSLQSIPSTLQFQQQLRYGLGSEHAANHPGSTNTLPSLPVPPSSGSSSPSDPSSTSTSEPATPSELGETYSTCCSVLRLMPQRANSSLSVHRRLFTRADRQEQYVSPMV